MGRHRFLVYDPIDESNRPVRGIHINVPFVETVSKVSAESI